MKNLIALFTLLFIAGICTAQIRFRENGKVGIKDENGKIIAPAKYDLLIPGGDLSKYDGVMIAGLNHQLGYLDLTTGEEVTSFQYYELPYFLKSDSSKTLAAYRLEEGGKYGLINNKGIELTEPLFDMIGPIGGSPEKIVMVLINEKWGYYSETGIELIPAQYDNAEPFSEGKAYVQLKERLFYIDKNGNEIK